MKKLLKISLIIICIVVVGIGGIVLYVTQALPSIDTPEDLEVEELCNGEKNEAGKVEKKAIVKKEKLPKECSKCNHLKKADEFTCSKCGFTPKFVENVEVEEGELKAVKMQNKHTKNDKVRIYAELLGYQRERALAGKNLSDGWVSNTYKDITGVWPRNMTNHAITPSEQTRGFIKHKAIAWAKSKNKLKGKF